MLCVPCCDPKTRPVCASRRKKVLNNLAPDTHLSITLRVSSVWGLRAASGCGKGSLQPPGSLAGCCLPVLQHSLRLPAWELAGGTCHVLEGPFTGMVTAGPTDILVVHLVHTVGHLAEGHPKVSSLKAALFLCHNTCAFPPCRSLLPQPLLHDLRLFPFPSFFFFLPPSLSFFFCFSPVSFVRPGCVPGLPW